MIHTAHRLSLALLLGTVATVGLAQPQPDDRKVSELLLGEWQLLKLGDRPILSGVRSTMVLTEGGNYRKEISGIIPATKHFGTYRLAGRTLDTMLSHGGMPQAGRWQIISVNADSLLLLNITPGDERKVLEYTRIKLK